jgi:SAM-dependent methyltransferase
MVETAPARAIRQESSGPQCPVCLNSNATAFAFERAGDLIYFCRSCSLEFQFPQPTDERLSAIYSSNYFLGSRDYRSLDNQRRLKRATARLYLNALARYLHEPHPRVIEIGCGHGEFLIEAQSRGYHVDGLEYSGHAAAEANRQLGFDAVRVGSPEANVLSRAAYDLVAAFDVIEHLRQPKQSLGYMHAALKPGGIIAIVTPSLDSWSRRLLGRYWMEYKTEHLTYFSHKSLGRLLSDIGFSNIQFSPNYKTLNLEYVAAHFARFPVPILTPFVRWVRRITPSKLAYKPVNIVASGLMAIARKPA